MDIDQPQLPPDVANGAHAPGVPVPGPALFPVVGIGGSAGGLVAAQQFFAHTPADSGMAFVLVLHLSPDYESNLASVIAQTTSMPVTAVTERVLVVPDHVYVISPSKTLRMTDGHIDVAEIEPVRGPRAPIDLFFRTLAESHGRMASAVVLSGTGADGSIGLPRVKENGGVACVQDPQEAEFDAMPRNAIGTGLVDLTLPVAEIPARLIAYWRGADGMQLLRAETAPIAGRDDETIRAMFALMRTRTGHDFSQYKLPTVLRRIGRRMLVRSVDTLAHYLEVLRTQPDEAQALLRDLLISVTNFFRDPEAWESVARIVPQIFAAKGAGDQVRVWVVGCATGEEAYTLAMLLLEYADTLPYRPNIQIFATDIDEDALAHARQGLYLNTIANDVSPERLLRFFTLEQGRYRVHRELRDMVLFAVHNVLHDPPFSRLDLVTCRNVLIYLNRTVQEQVLQLFHFTLRLDGYLLLGSSESTDGVPGLYTPVNKNQRLYGRRLVPIAQPSLIPTLPLRDALQQRARAKTGSEGVAPSYAELDMYMLGHLGPPTIIVNEQYEIVYLARGAGRFLELADGEPSTDVLKAIVRELRTELRTALFATSKRSESTQTRSVLAAIDGEQRAVQLTVQLLQQPQWARGYIAILFRTVEPSGEHTLQTTSDGEPMIRELEEELARTKDQLRTTVEQYETVVEEYRAANEELQAINEELRAATEELETSKEELQSVNEELTTTNQEYRHKIEEVSQSNNDLQNFMASTEIGTIFVDRELRIKRYTPSIEAIFNLIPADLNRPLAHVTHNLAYDQLPRDAARVLQTLQPVERELRSTEGHWYLARMQPYRTTTNVINGVVMTFVDITERKRAGEIVQQAHDTLERRVAERTAELLQLSTNRQELLSRLITAQEDERRRIARELHDGLGQYLSALTLDLMRVESIAGTPPEVRATLARLQTVAREIDTELDSLTMELRPPALDDLGLDDALRRYAQEWERTSSVPVEVITRGFDATRLPLAAEATAYRVVQEALTNVRKHAQASRVSVILERKPHELQVIVEDDGVGFEPETVARERSGGRQLGLVGMGERATLVGGAVTIESELGVGTTIFLHIPLASTSSANGQQA